MFLSKNMKHYNETKAVGGHRRTVFSRSLSFPSSTFLLSKYFSSEEKSPDLSHTHLSLKVYVWLGDRNTVFGILIQLSNGVKGSYPTKEFQA